MFRSRLGAVTLFVVTLTAFVALAPRSGLAQTKEKEKQKTEAKAVPKLPEGTEAFQDLAYGDKGERNTLDLFVPKSDAPLPLIIWIHGGGWRNGSKAGGPGLGFLKHGYAVASINYRLIPQAVFPAQIEDCKAAVRFLRANARKYNLNPDAFGAWGASAGGHLVALLGTSGDVKELEGNGPNAGVSSRVQAVCDFFGPSDLPNFTTGAVQAVAGLIGGSTSEKKELALKASPITYVSKDDPPFLIVHGDKDSIVPYSQSEVLRDALKKAGVECELITIKDGGHGGPGFSAPETVAQIQKFFDAHLKTKK